MLGGWVICHFGADHTRAWGSFLVGKPAHSRCKEGTGQRRQPGGGGRSVTAIPSSAQSPAPRCLIQAPCPLLWVRSTNGTTSRKSEVSERRVRPTQGCPRGATPTRPQPTEGPGTRLVPARTPPSLHREPCSPAAFSPGP